VSGILFSKTVRNSIVIPAQAGIHTEYANYVLHFHLVGYKESTSSSQHGFPLSREVVSGNAGNDGFSYGGPIFDGKNYSGQQWAVPGTTVPGQRIRQA
jgi:hypothetical protein